MKRFNINLPEGTYEKLRRESFETHKSMSQIVVEALAYGEKALVEEAAEISRTVSSDTLTKERGEMNSDDYTE